MLTYLHFDRQLSHNSELAIMQKLHIANDNMFPSKANNSIIQQVVG
jgi:hypothetical protein